MDGLQTHPTSAAEGEGRDEREPGRLRGSARLFTHLVGLPGKPAGVLKLFF
jgi:hypothetical protein